MIKTFIDLLKPKSYINIILKPLIAFENYEFKSLRRQETKASGFMSGRHVSRKNFLQQAIYPFAISVFEPPHKHPPAIRRLSRPFFQFGGQKHYDHDYRYRFAQRSSRPYGSE